MKPVKSVDVDVNLLAEAGLWVRQKYQIPVECTIDEQFEQEFHCKISRDEFGFSRDIVFDTEEDYLLFVLRWA